MLVVYTGPEQVDWNGGLEWWNVELRGGAMNREVANIL